MSRRRLLGAIPVVAVLAACSGAPVRGSTRNIRDHGAVGDGVSDDAAAITAAVAELKSGDTLAFPAGTYRFGRLDPAGGAAISIAGLSDVTIDFDAGAELVMDNLASDGAGTSHGIVVRGPATGISLLGVAVRWATQPAERSMGDGIRVVGYPSESSGVPDGWSGSEGRASRITLQGCRIQSSPQAGVIMMGVSDLTVTDLEVHDTMADGLHFNACRRGQVTNYTATNTGDDGLALVTYYSSDDTFDNSAETFSLSELSDWSDADLTISNVTINGGNANGVRLAGVNRSTLTDVSVRGVRTGAGVIIDSAAADSDADWDYLASRGVSIEGLTVDSSDSGFHVLARPAGATDDRFSRFDVDVSGVQIRDCPRWSVLVESLSDRPVSGVRLRDCTVSASGIDDRTGIVGLQTSQGVTLGKISITSSEPAVAFSANDSARLQVDELGIVVTSAGPDPTAAGPLAQFQNSTGSISTANVQWPQAPSSWSPIAITGATCTDGSQTTSSLVQFGTLTTRPTTAAGPIDDGC
ncbi:glycosyl hydrolase family 28-related protein [Williamsia soli]|uniref:glycosyl hydrolase family 28-related protein n=1 Tax=Williamsia soli TaxID=364929 RepID=UPI001A9CEC14|nr:glycosyl hydrolase family 28-related protein [Williamsia soli]